ncbi:glycoside hydrolase family 3 C-terminal domain-containing protein [Aureibaculum sp. A20]|uniref:Glycoside hydrolase family 3 C-terminal domain-containing protein n=1 Tax=Aureibaculum flavum TaxID=2795986 RepID=A0ABS0WNP4_9FLAO|nr:glycoside hydrolase family 3 protein [Aureibaculum flavum]MBJ2173577.1 glycoside hydrolase family 3 C-terminal domain-containing protein [Aureibaculum flavum]
MKLISHFKKPSIALVIMFFFGVLNSFSQSQFKFQNTSLSNEERVADLISQMTLKEKVSQMRYDAPAISRLGIPTYNWWNECLHGVARAGEATVFPQAIGMGATWNPDLMFKVGSAISDEARAKHHSFANSNRRGIYQGLTFWSPNINIFRDPRWGRGQETYGEDPFLTSQMAVNFIKALQGDDPKYLKVIATAKHFAVHSGPEKSRHEDNYHTSNRDLRQTYLPAFEAAVNDAKVHSVMCAYNRYNDEACCGSNLLLTDILRNEWKFDGYVVSDCWAISDFWEPNKHELVDTPEEAAALAVDRGTDLNCGSVFDPNLTEAVLKDIIKEDKIDLALSRLFMARFKLGMFDGDENVKWAKIPYSVVCSPEHYALSEKAAREAMVLLKNENNILPLNKNIKSIAVIGPNADFEQVLLGNYHGTPHNKITPLKAITSKLPNAKVYYSQGSEIAAGWPLLTAIPSANLKNGEVNGLNGEYYQNENFDGKPVFSRNDVMVDFSWLIKKPIKELKSDNFSVKWTGELIPEETGKYRIGLKARTGGKVYFNDSLRIDFTDEHEPKTGYFDADLEKGKAYTVKIEYTNHHTDSQVHLLWAKTDKDLLKPAIEVAKKAEVIILCLGLSPEIEGEEMPVVLEGFDKGDRSEITLPKSQIKLMKEIQALGKPTILVLMNGSALAINWAGENIPAILEAWYPGEFGGNAIADVLFGDYNPAGRLPVTFYKSVDDLPDFKSYDMENRTYKFFKGKSLFPFGHGLSYTNFTYRNFAVPSGVKTGEQIPVSVEVTNAGALNGDEVVQLYVSLDESNEKTPIRSLVGFKRIQLKAGETKIVKFNISSEKYAYIKENGEAEIRKGMVTVSIGGKQPSFNGIADASSTQVITKKIKITN